MLFRLLLLSLLALSLGGCLTPREDEDTPKAQALIDAAIAAHGGERYDFAVIEFDFRDKHYRLQQQGGLYQYQRIFLQEGHTVRDQLDNEGFVRTIDGAPVALPDSLRDAYANSVNSVAYFALLPHGLDDPAVQKQYLRTITLEGQPYHEIQVTFRREGGGHDYQDEFRHYLHAETHHLDYLAYVYDTNGGGMRFRAAYRVHEVGGLRLQDYINYEADPAQLSLDELPQAYNAETLTELSRIDLEAVQVQPLPRPEQMLP